MSAHNHKKHTRHFHLHRFSWLSFLLAGLLLIQLTYNFQQTGNFQVLAYATNVNRQDLHSLTNQERAANGLPGLRLNSKLNQAAQAKAQHMIANNYWSHNAPDGTTPWYFFDQAGYVYRNAGENLAYGFLTSDGAVQGWMDSPGHRANILGDYKDVGFGYANGENYQGNKNTVIVAMYGTLMNPEPEPTPTPTPPPAPAPTAVAPAAEETPPPAPTPAPSTEPSVEEQPKPKEKPEKKEANESSQEPIIAQSGSDQPVPPAPGQSVSTAENVNLFTIGALQSASWPVLASLGLVTLATIGFVVAHMRFMRRSWDVGKKYAVMHPLTDAAVMGSVLLLVFSLAGGHIQ